MTTIDISMNESAPDAKTMRAAMQFSKAAPRIGVEVEFHIQDLRRGGAPAADGRMRELKRNMRNRGVEVDEEIAAHMVEVKTQAYEIEDIHKLMREIARAQRVAVEETAKLGLKPAPTAAMAGLTMARAERNMIGPTTDDPQRGARPRAMLKALREQGMDGIVAYPLLNVSAQASVTAQSPEHLYDMAQRHYKLLPFLMTVMHNRAPVFDEQGNKSDIHGGIAARRALGRQGLIPAAFTCSRHAEDYIQRTLDTAYERPMIAYIDAKGQFNAAAAGEELTMKTLRERGLATRANALLSQSMDWSSVKIKNVPGSDLVRAEMRDMDMSATNATTLAALNAVMNMDVEGGRAVDRLLAGYGYAGAPVCYADMLAGDLKRVEQHGRRGLGMGADMRYGHGFMSYFARDLMLTIAPHARRLGLEEYLEPLRQACETGMTDAKVLDSLLHTPQDVRRYQREYDSGRLADTRRSLAMGPKPL
jgi:hypothetical protein